jgi:hypothetical protein
MNIEQPPSLIGLATQSDAVKYNPVFQDPYADENQEIREKIDNRSKGALFRIVLLATLFFIVFSQNVVYKLTHKASQYIMSSPIDIINADGLTTPKGIFVHALLFFIIMLFVVF